MILKKVILSNISSYEGYSEFDFSVNEEQNIILIGGKNGAGKTSLFNAIKLGLYGPLNFNYQTVHGQYLSKIKDIINKKAFTQESVEAFVVISFDYVEAREKVNYELKRSWKYVDQKIVETFEVKQDGIILNQDELLYFDNFLQTILPPNLFSLFFFDGEELSDIFVGSKFNQYIKEAFMVLCNFDTFDLIKKYSKNYIAKNNDSQQTQELEDEYNKLSDFIEKHETKIKELNHLITQAEAHIIKLKEDQQELDYAFKAQGGLSEEERLSINDQINYYENIRSQETYYLKNFLENLMPFIMLEGMASQISSQINKEQELEQKHHALDYLEQDNVRQSILNTLQKENCINLNNEQIALISSTIQKNLLSNLNTALEQNEFNIIHKLSLEQQNQVLPLLELIKTFDIKKVLNSIETKKHAQNTNAELNKKLRSSMPEDVVARYISDTKSIETALSNLEKEIIDYTYQVSSLSHELTVLESKQSKLRDALKAATQDQSIYELTNSINSMLGYLLEKCSDDKLRELEHYFKENFKTLFRKHNFIDEIQIDNNFNISIYRQKSFTCNEILQLINNLGSNEFSKYVGPTSLELLYKEYAHLKIDNINNLKKALEQELFYEREISIHERVNIQQLSKGEKQIYMLSLYWALIRISSHNVPFIIDTPYARIDTEHRDNVTTKFLPNVAHQVIILSTDEEIDKHYYNVLKPHISKEYLLVFDTEKKNTEIYNKYFYEVE